MKDYPHLFPDSEVPAAIEELFGFDGIVQGMHQYLPAELCEYILAEKSNIKSIYHFQSKIVSTIVDAIESSGVDTLSFSGLESLDKTKSYLFISNHRDIVLDSAFLNNVLHKNGFPTSQIAIGDNLMKHRLSELIFKLNKSFVVKRTGSPMDLYRYSVKLSEYISTLIYDNQDSVWLAQREGRAKDGNDKTQVGLLKMLSFSNKVDLKTFFKELNIVPLSISYEFNPCDHLLVQEHLAKKTNPEYKKEFKEDLQHMLIGLWGNKGNVNLNFGKPIDIELDVLDTEANSKKQLALLAPIIDSKIHQQYALSPINYVAYDILNGDSKYVDFYTAEQMEMLEGYFTKKLSLIEDDAVESGRDYLLKMYANPLINKGLKQ